MQVDNKHDQGKLRYNLVEPYMLRALAEVLDYGATKYEPYSWRGVENGKERYTSALFRHLEEWREGSKHDTESTKHHLAHVATNALFLLGLDND